MVREKSYYSPADVALMLSVSKTSALQIFHQFEKQGKLMKFGPKTLRIGAKEFHKWVECQKADSKS